MKKVDKGKPPKVALASTVIDRLDPRTTAFAERTNQGSYAPARNDLADIPLDANVLADAFEGRRSPVGFYLIDAGSNRVRFAVLDVDNHLSELTWQGVTSRLRPLMDKLRERGFHPHCLRSGGGGGIHVYLLWEVPQQAAGVRAALIDAIEAARLAEGTEGGIGWGVVEIFPKQNRIEPNAYGNLIAAPFLRKSVPLDDDLNPIEGMDPGATRDWFRGLVVSPPVTEVAELRTETRTVSRREPGEVRDRDAAVAVLVHRYPEKGGRDNFVGAVVGTLYRAGWEQEVIEELIAEVVGQAADDDGVQTRVRSVRNTCARIDESKKAPGRPSLEEFLGSDDLELFESALRIEPLPTIIVNEQLRVVAPEAWAALEKRNRDKPFLFRFGDTLARVERDETGGPRSRVLKVDELRYELAFAANWLRRTQKGLANAVPSQDVIRTLLVTPADDKPLPELLGVTTSPVLGPKGQINTAQGYDPATKLFFLPGDDSTFPTVSEEPTGEDVRAAKELLSDDLFGEFPFEDRASKAHAVGLLLLPFLRSHIGGSTPLHLVASPKVGTGKTLLAMVAAWPFLGQAPASDGPAKDEDEFRKKLTAKLIKAPSIVVLDNVNELASGHLARALTTGSWADRILGVSNEVEVPVRCVWVATGNNPSLSSEIARRSVRIYLNAKVEQPWLRDDFRHPNLLGWVELNRGRVIGAALTLCRAWYLAGQPVGRRSLGSFESWANVVGGVLENAGIGGFLENVASVFREADSEGEAHRALIQALWNSFKDKAISTHEAYPLAQNLDLDLGDRGESSRRMRLGKLLGRLRGQRFVFEWTKESGKKLVELEVVVAGKARNGAQLWKVRPLFHEGQTPLGEIGDGGADQDEMP